MKYEDIDPTAVLTIKFDESSPLWNDEVEYNRHFIKIIMNVVQDKFYATGYLFVNSILERMDCQILPEGQLVGWSRPTSEWVDWSIDEGGSTDECLLIVLKPEGFIWDKLGDF